MLLALVLFFIIAGLFFVIISNSGLRGQASFIKTQQAISSAQTLADSPELSYGKHLAIDQDKLVALKNISSFDNFWNLQGLVIKKQYPVSPTNIECNGANYALCNTFTLKSPPIEDYVELTSFVSLCRKQVKSSYVYDKCEIGTISVYINKQ